MLRSEPPPWLIAALGRFSPPVLALSALFLYGGKLSGEAQGLVVRDDVGLRLTIGGGRKPALPGLRKPASP